MQTMQSRVNCAPHFIVIILLPLLFFVAMIAGYLGFIPLNIPIYTLVYIGFIFFVFLLFTKHNANYASCKMHGGQVQMELALREELMSKSLTLNNQTKSILHIDDFLNRYYIDIRNDNFVSVASSIFPMLGILGTFVAMAISMPNFTASSTSALDSEISVLLSGVGSAFFASIYGIFLSLLWTYFEKRGLSKIDEYFQNIETLFSSHVWTEDELTIHQYSKGDLEDNRFLSALQSTFNLDFIKEQNQQQLQAFQSIMQESNRNFEILTSAITKSTTQIENVLMNIDQSSNAIEARERIENNIAQFTQATQILENSAQNITQQLDRSLHQNFEMIDEEIASIVVKLADFATHVSAESSEVQKSIRKYHQSIDAHTKVK